MRGIFAMKVSEGPDVRGTQSEVVPTSVDNVFSEDRILFQVEIRVRHRGVGHVLLQQREAVQDSRAERHDDGAQRSEERKDSVKAIGSKEVGRVLEESNVMDSISVVVFDTRLLRESRQRKIDFVNQLDVYYRRPRQWALSSPVIPTRRVDLREKDFE